MKLLSSRLSVRDNIPVNYTHFLDGTFCTCFTPMVCLDGLVNHASPLLPYMSNLALRGEKIRKKGKRNTCGLIDLPTRVC